MNTANNLDPFLVRQLRDVLQCSVLDVLDVTTKASKAGHIAIRWVVLEIVVVTHAHTLVVIHWHSVRLANQERSLSCRDGGFKRDQPHQALQNKRLACWKIVQLVFPFSLLSRSIC